MIGPCGAGVPLSLPPAAPLKRRGSGMKDRKDGVTIVYDEITRKIDGMAALVFAVVHRHCRMNDGYCHCSVDTMAKLLGFDERTVRRQLVRLEEMGMIRKLREPTPRQTAAYEMLYVPKEVKSEPKDIE